MLITRLFLIAAGMSLVSSHAISIWEMLPTQEKMGQIMYFFVHLVNQNCASSYTPDCHHVLLVRGLSALVNMGEHTLNKLDPHQRDAQRVIWGAVMGDTWLPLPGTPTPPLLPRPPR
ncbi:rhythmically expressed gene 5 protein-like [Portunus trituberculatus]|uniref:rhythmically expressed gene 5 protein-like n=1 Tax=Portunus trituberculatus TaxID=210409 RepID=UPI001E1CEF54|nr:rhythmically expressed gene 5 protein-like [Portunus trituberculatus]